MIVSVLIATLKVADNQNLKCVLFSDLYCQYCALKLYADVKIMLRHSKICVLLQRPDENYKFICPLCPYHTEHSSAINRHFRIHLGKRPFFCSFCNSCFTTRSGLLRHSRVHTGEKPYDCDLCDYKTNDKSNLKKHFLNRHGSDENLTLLNS
jgi:FOG: Zn-finger